MMAIMNEPPSKRVRKKPKRPLGRVEMVQRDDDTWEVLWFSDYMGYLPIGPRLGRLSGIPNIKWTGLTKQQATEAMWKLNEKLNRESRP